LRFSELASQAVSNGDFRDPVQLAREKVDWILDNHHPQPLDNQQRTELEQILVSAEKKFGTI